MSEDNWKHRDKGMRCETCMWFVQKQLSSKVPSKEDLLGSDHDVEVKFSSLGRCRRRSPTMSGFPAVFKSDWCGDHKLDEKKV